MSEPVRTCAGCRAAGSRQDLVRLARDRSGGVTVDLAGTAPGRGAYVHPRRECLEAARTRGGLQRALRAAVPPKAWETLEALVRLGEGPR